MIAMMPKDIKLISLYISQFLKYFLSKSLASNISLVIFLFRIYLKCIICILFLISKLFFSSN